MIIDSAQSEDRTGRVPVIKSELGEEAEGKKGVSNNLKNQRDNFET